MRVRAIFEIAKNEAEHVWGPMDILFMVGTRSAFPKLRNYAYCSKLDLDTCLIVVAPKMKLASDDRCVAVVRHEIGHAIDFLIPKNEVDAAILERGLIPYQTPERKADQIAEITYDEPIYYDDDTIQSLLKGIRPRPSQLGL